MCVHYKPRGTNHHMRRPHQPSHPPLVGLGNDRPLPHMHTIKPVLRARHQELNVVERVYPSHGRLSDGTRHPHAHAAKVMGHDHFGLHLMDDPLRHSLRTPREKIGAMPQKSTPQRLRSVLKNVVREPRTISQNANAIIGRFLNAIDRSRRRGQHHHLVTSVRQPTGDHTRDGLCSPTCFRCIQARDQQNAHIKVCGRAPRAPSCVAPKRIMLPHAVVLAPPSPPAHSGAQSSTQSPPPEPCRPWAIPVTPSLRL